MNNNFENNENNNNVQDKLPSILPVEEPVIIQEGEQIEQSAIVPETLEQSVITPVVSAVEEPMVMPEVSEQPVITPVVSAVEEPMVMPEVSEQPVISQVVNPVEEPMVMPQALEQPVITPVVSVVEEPMVMQEVSEQPVITPVVNAVEEPMAMQSDNTTEQSTIVPNISPIDEPIMFSGVTPVTETVESNNINEDNIVKNKKKGTKIIIFALMLLVFCFIAALVYYVYSTNEKVIINNSIKQLESLTDYIELPTLLNKSDEYSEKGNFTIKMDETDDITINQLVDVLNDKSFDYNFSKTSEKILLELNVSNDTDKIGGVKVLANSNTGYIFLNEIFDKYIEVEELKDLLSSTNYNDLNDYDYLYNFMQKSFINNVDKDDFIKDTAEITIDGTTKKVNSLKLEYNDKQIYELFNLVITDIKDDEKANEIVTNIYNDFENYNMDSAIELIDEEHMSTYIYTVYTNKLTNTVEGMDFDYKYYEYSYDYANCYDSTGDEEIEDMSSTNKNYKVTPVDAETSEDYSTYDYSTYDYTTEEDTTYDYSTYDYTTDDYTTESYEDCGEYTYEEKTASIEYRNDKEPRIYFNENNSLLAFASLEKTDQGLTINVYKTESEKLGFIKINITKTLYEITADFTIGTLEYKTTISTNIEEITAGEEYNLKTKLSCEVFNGIEKISGITINLNSTAKTSASINETVTESVKYDQLTDEEGQEIYTNIMNIITEEMGQY